MATLRDAPLPAGRHEIGWGGLDDRGGRAAPGVYFCDARAGNERASVRFVLLP